MKKVIVFSLLFIISFFGCASENPRQELVTRFQSAYPANWQQKLLEYDIEQGNIYKERDCWERLQAVSDAFGDLGQSDLNSQHQLQFNVQNQNQLEDIASELRRQNWLKQQQDFRRMLDENARRNSQKPLFGY